MSTSTPNTLPLNISTEDIRILVVEDEDATRDLVYFCLKQDGYQVVAVDNGAAALRAFADSPSDLVILDVNMPVLDGWSVCAELRKRTDVPIMMLTANARPDDIVLGMELGADYYITKPFTLSELRARVLAALRRASSKPSSAATSSVHFGGITLNEDSGEVRVENKAVGLGAIEYHLLKYLMHNPDRPISNEELLIEVWGYQVQATEDFNMIRVTMRRLRNKVEENASSPKYLKTVHGRGYQFCTV